MSVDALLATVNLRNTFDSDEMRQISDKGVGVAYRPYGIELIPGQLTDLCDCHDALLAVKCQLNSRAVICAVNLVAEGRCRRPSCVQHKSSSPCRDSRYTFTKNGSQAARWPSVKALFCYARLDLPEL